jgi:hypothetical protein
MYSLMWEGLLVTVIWGAAMLLPVLDISIPHLDATGRRVRRQQVTEHNKHTSTECPDKTRRKLTKNLVANIVFADEVPDEFLVDSEPVDNLLGQYGYE